VRSILCLLSAVGFGLMAIFAKLAYAEGVSVEALLMLRFGLAGLVLLAFGIPRGWLSGLRRPTILAGLAMGAVGYATQSGFYLAALTRTAATQVALVFCVYPLLVMAAAVAIGRERASRRRIVALGIALAGIALVLNGAQRGSFDLLGVLLAAGSALVYTAYILIGDRVSQGAPPMSLTTLVCLGAFATYGAGNLARGGVDLSFGPAGWFWVGMIVAISTVGAIVMFFAGMASAGPTIASLLAIIEPVVTVVLAALVFGDTLRPVQVLGGLLVLSAVLVVQWPSRQRATVPLPAHVAPVGV
jgi:drug/metabolite transporter (DMT)-like permease